ncbi:hypothetical protein AB0I69_40250 [Streptomyces sp. NPDC050508]|uniref:hypothetical protein n=1 Tax=Streptomyces sp. NPDC050508 TaxID=3155405 RepID=UPI003444FA0F
MVDSRARWRLRACAVALLLLGGGTIVASLQDSDPWWSWLPHLWQGVLSVALGLLLFAAGGRRRRWRVKKRSLPPL